MSLSALVVLAAMIGGTRFFAGPIIGAAVVWVIRSVVSSYTEYWTLILGVLMVAVVMFARQGIVGYLAQLREKRGIIKG
jgi:branched-chain amino acid transport system permease protein